MDTDNWLSRDLPFLEAAANARRHGSERYFHSIRVKIKPNDTKISYLTVGRSAFVASDARVGPGANFSPFDQPRLTSERLKSAFSPFTVDSIKEMIKLEKGADPTGYTLVVPSISVGNVAQLAVDLLIYNGRMKKIGQLVSPAFIPFLGADPYSDGDSWDICTTGELYMQEEAKVIALQIRSPPFTDKMKHFFQKLLHFVQRWNISKVIVLTGEWQFARIDEQLGSEPTRYLASPRADLLYAQEFCQMGWKKLEERADPLTGRLELSGGGFALGFLQFLSSEKIPCAVLLKFCSEGDNSPDAVELARFVDRWIRLVSENDEATVVWKEPPSWRHVFGCRTPREIY